LVNSYKQITTLLFIYINKTEKTDFQKFPVPPLHCLYFAYSVETLTDNFDIGDFCKKFRNKSIFIFPCPHLGVYGFCIYILPEERNHPKLFFSNVRVCQVTPRLKPHFARNIMHYLFPEYFQSLC
jgi:hypothetical protein